LADGERIELGEVVLEVRATPGHTPESISIVVHERRDDPPFGVLTGDTLFIGDVGRPDLLASVGVTADDLGRQLYHSLHQQLMTLPDETRVYPAHGAGSACGKNLSTETVSTLGEQRRTNYALAPMSEDDFVAAVTQGQAAAPLYFSFAANRNRLAREVFHEDEPVPAMTLDAVLDAQRNGAAVIDTRDEADFAAGHLRGSTNVSLGGRFAEYSGEIVRPGTSIVIVANPGYEGEARVRLARIGFDEVLGVLDDPFGAFVTHPELVDQASRLSAHELMERLAALPTVQLVDVRGPGETADGVVPGARLIQLPQLLERVGELDPSLPTVVYCASGYRSSVAASALRALGFADVSDLLGGYVAWVGAGGAHVVV
jgi:rhodanese-related sulfurtransferase